MKTKKCRVIRLASKYNSAPIDDQSQVGQGLSCNEAPNFHKYNPQHLYILSDDEIRKGDWYLQNMVKPVQSAAGEIEEGDYRNCKKIIATTDPELIRKKVYRTSKKGETLHQDSKGTYEWRCMVAQPSKAFIEEYCKVGGIDEVYVEYEETGPGFYADIWFPKVNLHNEVTIHYKTYK